MTTIPNGSPYETILDGYLGTDYADQKSGFVTQKDVLWIKFLAETGLKATDPLVVAQDPSVLMKFVAFVQKTYDSMQVGTNLSPDETSRRKLMFSVYDLIVLMLETLQKNVGVVGNNVVFLSKYQKEYSTMMGRVSGSFQIGGATSLPSPNPADPTKWTLGYGGITMDDYLRAATENSIAGASVTTQITSVNSKVPLPAANVQQTPTGVIKDALQEVPQSELIALGPATRTVTSGANVTPSMNTLKFDSTPTTVTFNYVYKQQYSATVTNYNYDSDGNLQQTSQQKPTGFFEVPVSYTVSFLPTDNEQTKLDKVKAGFNTFLGMGLANQATLPPGYAFTSDPVHSVTQTIPQAANLTVLSSMTQPITFYNMSNIASEANITVIRNITRAWDPLYNMVFTSTTDSTQNAKESAASRRRGAVNSQLQQYITDSQTQKQILSNRADAQTSQENQSQTGFNQGASLLHTMIGQLSTILTSIFQVSG